MTTSRRCLHGTGFVPHSAKLSLNKNENENDAVVFAGEEQQQETDSNLHAVPNRRLFLGAAAAAVGCCAYGKLAATAWQQGRWEASNEAMPAAHWDRVVSTFTQAVQYSLEAESRGGGGGEARRRPFRILEVGIGNDWKTLRKSAYSKAIGYLLEQQTREDSLFQGVELVGVDLHPPSSLSKLLETSNHSHELFDPSLVGISTRQGNVQELSTLFAASKDQFDVVTCHFVLCSVENPTTAVRQMAHQLRRGGTLAYVEHVAADPSTHKFLEWQQQVLDPLQQAVADNCHLHRTTLETMAEVLELPWNDKDDTNLEGLPRNKRTTEAKSNRWLAREEFVLSEMWPISYQCRGIVQIFS